jgi:hypothetical protein
VAVVNGVVRYTKNGTSLKSFTPALVYPFMADAQFYGPQATLQHVVMSAP